MSSLKCWIFNFILHPFFCFYILICIKWKARMRHKRKLFRVHFSWYLSSIAQHYIQTWHDVVLSDVEGKALYVKVAFSWHYKSEILHADISTNFLLYSKSIRSNFYAREFSFSFSLSLKLEFWVYIQRHFKICARK